MKITLEIIKGMEELKRSGLSYYKIAKKLNINIKIFLNFK
jgi:DNA-binding CsgD family transcriptional regulator